MTAESKFQRDLIDEIKQRLPDAVILKNDAGYCQGIPDLSIFVGDRWGMLECKESMKATHQPNQDRYVERLNRMSFASFIYPENKEDVLNAMERSLKGHT